MSRSSDSSRLVRGCKRSGFLPAVLLATGVLTASCAFLLDTDELKEGTGGGGSGGIAGAAGSTGGSAGTAGAAGSAGSASIPIADAPAAMAEAACSTLEDCLGPAMGMVFSDEDCVELLTRTYQDAVRAPFEASMAENRAAYHPDLMPACVQAYGSLSCADTDAFLPPECEAALEGLVPEGESCNNTTECVGSNYCATDVGCPGICRPPIEGGGACTDTDVCAPGFACFEGVCALKGQQNADCGENHPPCVTGLICLGEDKNATVPTPGTCVAVSDAFTRGSGYSCEAESLSFCQEGFHCAFKNVFELLAVTGLCKAPSSLGEPCQTAFPDMCPSGAYCAVSWISTDGNCLSLPGDGQPCATGWVLKNPCKAYHRCIETGAAARTCHAMKSIGQTCIDDAQCYSGYCDEGTCVAPNSCTL